MDLMQHHCIPIRTHLRGLGVPIFQAKNVSWKMYQVHICFSVRVNLPFYNMENAAAVMGCAQVEPTHSLILCVMICHASMYF